MLSSHMRLLLVLAVLACSSLVTPEEAALAPRQPAEKAKARLDQYGDPLPEGAIARFGALRLRHDEQINSVAFSPNGKTLASASADTTILIWSVPP